MCHVLPRWFCLVGVWLFDICAVCCGCLCFLQLGSACVVFWVAEMIWCVCWEEESGPENVW